MPILMKIGQERNSFSSWGLYSVLSVTYDYAYDNNLKTRK